MLLFFSLSDTCWICSVIRKVGLWSSFFLGNENWPDSASWGTNDRTLSLTTSFAELIRLSPATDGSCHFRSKMSEILSSRAFWHKPGCFVYLFFLFEGGSSFRLKHGLFLSCRFQPHVEREFPVWPVRAWTCARALCCGGSRYHVQQRLRRPVHAPLHQHPERSVITHHTLQRSLTRTTSRDVLLTWPDQSHTWCINLLNHDAQCDVYRIQYLKIRSQETGLVVIDQKAASSNPSTTKSVF